MKIQQVNSLKEKRLRAVMQKHINIYLTELGHLSLAPVSENDLLSLEATKKIQDLYLSHNFVFFNKIVIPFSSKVIIKKIFKHLIESRDDEVCIFTEYSEYCGAYKMETLKLFNLDFNFKDEHSGIISIIQVNYFNRILLDFYKIEDHEIIEIEVFGDDWGIINFPVQENASL